jgi:hypothetical protein
MINSYLCDHLWPKMITFREGRAISRAATTIALGTRFSSA